MAQVSFDRVAGRRPSRSLALTRRFGVLLCSCRPAIDAARLFLVDGPAFTPKQDMNTTVTVADADMTESP